MVVLSPKWVCVWKEPAGTVALLFLFIFYIFIFIFFFLFLSFEKISKIVFVFPHSTVSPSAPSSLDLSFIPRLWPVNIVAVVQSLFRVLTFCDPMDCSTPGFPVHHQLLELAQAHVHWISDAIQPSHPLSSPSPPAFSLSQHQGLFQWIMSLHQLGKLFRIEFLLDWLVWSPCYPRDSQASSLTPQLKSINSSVLSFLYGPTLTSTWVLEKP